MFTCPFCYNVYDKRKVKYVCPVPACGTEAAPAKEPIKCKKPGCPGLATDRICPSCLEKVPRTALDTPNLNFSIVGVSTSGKTNYITVMLEELMNFPGLRLAMGNQTSETRDIQNINRGDIYINHRPAGASDAGEARPQIWSIRNLDKDPGFFSRNTVPTYTFSIYDGAGENVENEITVNYIRASDAFVITLDPLILSGVQAFVPPEVVRNSYKADAFNQIIDANAVVNNLVNYLKEKRGIPENKPLEIPVAVVMTKFDTVISHPSFNNALVKRERGVGVRNKKVRVEEFDQVHDEIAHWLRTIGEQQFINSMDANFATFDRKGNLRKRYYKFFAVSSFGITPTVAGTTPQNIQPFRILDPILWLFKLKKFID